VQITMERKERRKSRGGRKKGKSQYRPEQGKKSQKWTLVKREIKRWIQRRSNMTTKVRDLAQRAGKGRRKD